MKPGRKLDALIAEKIFGALVANGKIFRYEDDYGEEDLAQAREYPIPEYSTDITAAWEVVEHLHMFGKRIEMNYDGAARTYDVGFGTLNPIQYTAMEDTAPHAICIAALKAIGVNVE